MKNYVIALLVVCCLMSLSFLYKAHQTSIYSGFPLTSATGKPGIGESPLYLYVFFSRHNCPVCLESIQVLNKLPRPFIVRGIVPTNELKDEIGFRRTTGATFPLIARSSRFEKFAPLYSPAIVGTGSNGQVIFVLPSVPEQVDYLYSFLTNVYSHSFELLTPHEK